MKLAEKDIEEFQSIYRQATGKEIAYDEASHEASMLVELMRAIINRDVSSKDNDNDI